VLDVQSRAPEYGGSSQLPPSTAQTLAAIADEPAASATVSAAPSLAAPPAAPVAVPRLPGTPDLTKEGLYAFSGGGIELVVDPRRGALVRLSLDGTDALVGPGPATDGYSAELEGSTLVLTNAAAGLTKRVRLDTARRSVELSYTIANSAPSSLRASAADIERVPSSTGLTFFPGAPKLLPGSTLKLNVWQPIVWFAHEQARDSKTVEASVESREGWIANVHDGLVLVKVVSDAARPRISIACAYDAATNERPWVEIGTHTGFDLAPGGSATTNLRLFLRRLPPSVLAKSGNQELVGFVRGVIQ